MKVLFFAYPSYADFEIAHVLFFLRKKGKAMVTTMTLDGNPVESLAGLKTLPQLSISDVKIRDYDLVLIPGGDGVHEVMDELKVHSLLQEAKSLGIPIASICASAALLGKAGLLQNKRFTCLPGTYKAFKEAFKDANYTEADIEVEEGFITAKGTAFAEFPVAVGHELGLWKDTQEADHVLKFCKGNT